MTAISQKAPDFTRSMIEPETIEAVVQEKSRNAAQKTPFRRAQSAVSAAVSVPCTGLPPICGAHQLAPRRGERRRRQGRR